MPFAVGIDIGGTFTDAIAIDTETGQTTQAKSPTTPRDLVAGVMDSLELLSNRLGIPLDRFLKETTRFSHSTTQSTNALFTRTGAKTGLIATAGFGEQILIMRARGRVAGLTVTERLHYSATDKPEPLVGKELISEVNERVDYKGKILVKLDASEAREAIDRLVKRGISALAVSFLWSFKNPENELLVEKIAKKKYPHLKVSLSSQLFPVIGEYERTATCVANAYVSPVIASYIERLERRLEDAGLSVPPLILTSSGGVVSTGEAVSRAVTTVESGPAGGMIASEFLARVYRIPNVIITDVGGTTFKVGIIENGSSRIASTSLIGKYSLLNPAIEIDSIGSGGGSIAWVDINRLRVGPNSAQAEPGPACYGKGGDQPTVTDADVLLGYINPDYFCGGAVKLYKELSEKAIREKVADILFGGDTIVAAAGIRDVIDANMADLIHQDTVEKGYDPREFVMMAYGGAGPTHCSRYATEANVSKVLVPYDSTVHSAYGAVVSDISFSFAQSDPHLAPLNVDKANRAFSRMEDTGSKFLKRENFEGEMLFKRSVDMKYRRQMNSITIPVKNGFLQDNDAPKILADFEKQYARAFGKDSGYTEAGIEITTFRLDAIGLAKEKPKMISFPSTKEQDTSLARKGKREVYWRSERASIETPIYDGDKMKPGYAVDGPAIIEHYGTTIVVEPRQKASVDQYLNTWLEVK